MARLPRLCVQGYPHHIIQRGNNRQAIVLSDDDRRQWLALLHDAAVRYQVLVHAYVLMDNHFHLIATPQTADGLPLMMQQLGRSYVRYFNKRIGRTGTLFEGRYRSTVIESQRYLLACMVYVDLNPERAGMAAQALDYPWSSHAHMVGARHDALITPHPEYWQLGNTPFAREGAYAALVQAGLSQSQTQAMTDSALKGWPLGDAPFVAQLQKSTDRRITPKRAGRPFLLSKTVNH